MKSHFVYIMMNRSGMPYTGITNYLEARTLQHRQGLSKFTGKYRLVKLAYYEVCDNAYDAITREKQIKGWTHDKKIALIRTQNPALKDLVPELFGWRAAQFLVTRRRAGSRVVQRQILPPSG